MHRVLKFSSLGFLIGAGLLLMAPASLVAQKKLNNTDRAVYASIGYTKLGFGEVNRQLLTARQVRKIERRIQRIQADYGAVIVFASLIDEEVNDWEQGHLRGLPKHFVGADPRAERNHVIILFDDAGGKNWIRYGSDNTPYFTDRTSDLSQLFASKFRRENAYRSLRSTLKAIKQVYSRLAPAEQHALRHPALSAAEWIALAHAEMEMTTDYDSAVLHLHKALELDSASAYANLLLGHAYLELEQWNQAENALSQAWTANPTFDTALGLLALSDARNNQTAVKWWTRRVQQHTTDFEKKLDGAAHHENRGAFISNTVRSAFHELFADEIAKRKSMEPEEAVAQ